MSSSYHFEKIPRSRIATFDTFDIGMSKHHISALLEFDVTNSRRQLKVLRKGGTNISFNAWLIKVISMALEQYRAATAFVYSKKKLIIFDHVNVSILVEKKIGDKRVPIPVVIEKTNEKSASAIAAEIQQAKGKEVTADDIVLNRKSSYFENLYYHLPGFLRRAIWKMMLHKPRFIFNKMGNVVVTSVGMMGEIKGWFIHRSIHPISFGIGSILKKPVVIDDQIKIREILHMTILIDHDVIDGAPMVRLLKDLTNYIENGAGLDEAGDPVS